MNRLPAIILSCLSILFSSAFAQQPKPAVIDVAGSDGVPPKPGSVQMKNGLIISGLCCSASTLYPQLPGILAENRYDQRLRLRLIHQGAREVFVHDQNSAKPVYLNDVWPALTYPVSQKLTGRKSFSAARPLLALSGFNEQGISVGQLLDQGQPEEIQFVVTGINELYAEVACLSYQWNFRVTLDAFSPAAMSSILSQVTDADTDPIRRLELVRMLVRADRLADATALLDRTITDFPEIAAQQREFRSLIREQRAREAVTNADRMISIGIHSHAVAQARLLEDSELTPETEVRVNQIRRYYEDQQLRIQRAQTALQQQVSMIEDEGQRNQSNLVIRELTPQFDEDSIDRLATFEALLDSQDQEADVDNNEMSSPEDLVAMAISGFLLGAENGIRSLHESLILADTRQRVLDYLRSNPEEITWRRELADQIARSEGVGIDRVAAMIAHLPAITPASLQFASKTSHGEFVIPATGDSAGAVGTVPPEYRGTRNHPLVIVFSSGSTDNVYAWCRFLSLWDGCITVVPTMATDVELDPDAPRPTFDLSADSHSRLLAMIRKVRQSFRIDDDRVFVAGLGHGGVRAMDMAVSHPDLFAGVISLGGTAERPLQFMVSNAVRMPWYLAVSESQDQGRWFEQMKILTSRLFKRDDSNLYFDALFVKSSGLGPLRPQQEFRHVSAWMALHARDPWPQQIEAQILRSTDRSWNWVKLDSIPTQNAALDGAASDNIPDDLRPAKLNVRCNNSNHIIVETAPSSLTLLLSPQLHGIDLSKPISLDIGRKHPQIDYVPSIADLLDELYETGDRKRLCYMKVRVEK
jgi:pimeloyl-ACP methyl ester carboxylesterase